MRVAVAAALLALFLSAPRALAYECASAGEKDAAPCVPSAPGEEPEHAPLASWVSEEGFRLRSPNGNFRLRVGLNLGLKYEPTFEPSPLGNNWSNFPITFARVYLDGNLFRPWIKFWLQVEFGRFPPALLDAFVELEPWSFFSVRGGLQYTPMSRHESFGPGGILFPEWSTTANYFWTGYQRGITLYGHTNILEYYAGFYDGTSTRQTTSVPGNFVLLARLSINPLGPVLAHEIPWIQGKERVPFRLGFTVQGDWSRTSITDFNLNPSSGLVVATPTGAEQGQGMAAADFVFQISRISFLSEFYYRHIEPRNVITPSFDQLGAWAQLGVGIWRRSLVAGARINWIEPSLSLANDHMVTGEVMLAWWIAVPYLSLKARYEVGWQEDPGPAPASDPDLYNFVEIPLVPGVSHLGTLQLTLSL